MNALAVDPQGISQIFQHKTTMGRIVLTDARVLISQVVDGHYLNAVQIEQLSWKERPIRPNH